MDSKIREIDLDRLWDANRDYVARMEREGINLVYNTTLDTLFIEFGNPKEALSEHVTDSVMARVKPDLLKSLNLR